MKTLASIIGKHLGKINFRLIFLMTCILFSKSVSEVSAVNPVRTSSVYPVISGNKSLIINRTAIFSTKNDSALWRQLFNGKDLIGWKHVGGGSHYVEEGFIKSEGGMGLLYWSGEKFGNCTIRVVYRMRDKNSNSGVFIRIPIIPFEEWMPVFYGYEVQIDNNPEASNEDDYHYTGTLYSLTKPLAKMGKPGPEWNIMEITLDGDRTIVVLNGVKVTDYTEGDPVPPRKFDFEPFRGSRPQSGYMGLQNHSAKDVVFFKEVSVKPIKKK
jgi:hypothetical protein